MAKNNSQNLFDRLLGNALDILRLAANEKKKVLARLAKLEKELIGKLSENDLPTLARRDINTVLKNAAVSIGNAYGQIASMVDGSNLALFAAEEMQHALQIYFGLEAVKRPPQAYFDSVMSNVLIEGSPAAEWWHGQNANAQFKFAGQVRQGLVSGETNQQIIQRIVGKSGSPGVMDTLRRNASTLVQTSVQAVANDARRTTFKNNDDLIKGLRQVSTLDSHTSLVCMAYSGAEWDLDYNPIGKKKLPYKGGVPRHMNCRSVEVPITKTFKELGLDIPEAPVGTRASDEGQIAADTTFDSFLKRKSRDYLDEKLGPGRAELFAAGKITLRDLVNGDGNPISLEALRALANKKRGG